MRYNKQPFTFENQAKQLLQRGLLADPQELIQRLKATNYYRFTSYLCAWHQRVSDLFSKHPNIDLSAMGLKPDWQEHPLWNYPS